MNDIVARNLWLKSKRSTVYKSMKECALNQASQMQANSDHQYELRYHREVLEANHTVRVLVLTLTFCFCFERLRILVFIFRTEHYHIQFFFLNKKIIFFYRNWRKRIEDDDDG